MSLRILTYYILSYAYDRALVLLLCHATNHYRVLPPGEFNGIILQPFNRCPSFHDDRSNRIPV